MPGPKPTCLCGQCRICKHREQDYQYKARKKKPIPAWEPTDEQLDEMMTQYFLRKGYDRLEP